MIEITEEMIDAYMDGVDGGAWRALDARSSDPFRGWVRGGLAAVAPLMVAAEREACAELADAEGWGGKVPICASERLESHRDCADMIADFIRARGDRP